MKLLAIILLAILLISPASAIKIHELPFASDVHLGFINGVGIGVNIGFNAGFNLLGLKFGPEMEQTLTTANNSVEIGGTRFGGFIKADVYENIAVNFHLGSFGFQPTGADLSYISNGTNYILSNGVRYTGKYTSISLDINYADFVLSPRYYYNVIDGQGGLSEIDLNFAYSFGKS